MGGATPYLKSFCRRIYNDLRQKELLPLKLLFFVHSSTVYVLYPYLTIHMRELGISVEETAIMSAITPVASILVPPLAGMVADRIGNFRILMAIFSSLGGAAALLLLIVPVGRVTVHSPTDVHLRLSCDGSLTASQEYPCTILPKIPDNETAIFEACGLECTIPAGFNQSDDARYDVTVNGDMWKSLQYRVEPASGRVFFQNTGLFDINCTDSVACTKKMKISNSPSGLQATNTTCPDIFNKNVTMSLVDGSALTNCTPLCLLNATRSRICTQTSFQKVIDPTFTFWAYLSVRVLIGIISSTAFAMFEGAVIAVLREHKADYGLQRIYATIGGMISSPLSGVLIDYASQGKTYIDFRPAFYLYATLKIASGFLMLTFNLEFKVPAKNVVSDVMTVMKNIELVALFTIIFILGSAWGYIESFLFWLLQDLGGSRSLMGVTITVGGLAGIPLLALSGPIIDKIGHAQVLFIGFIFYTIRLLGYSLIYNPWLCLIFEAMESVTSSLSFTAAVTYAAKLSSSSTDTSIQGMLGGLYYGVGKGAGSLAGGFLMKWIGTRHTYQCFSAMCAVVGCAYFFFNKFYLQRRPQVEGNDIVKKQPKYLETHPINTGEPNKYTCNINLGYEPAEDEKNETKEEKPNSNEDDKNLKNLVMAS